MEYSEYSYAARLAQVITIILIGITAVIGNLFVLLAVSRFSKLRTSPNIFVANLSLTDGIFGILLLNLPPNILQQSNELQFVGCQIWGYMAVVCSLVSTFTLAAIAINRWYLITHAQNYLVIFTKRKSALVCAVVWILALGIVSPSLFGWGAIEYNPMTNACSYARKASSSFHYFLIIIGFGVPLVVVLACYVRLFMVVRESQRRVRVTVASMSSAESQDNREKTHVVLKKDKDMKLTKTLVTVFVIYVILLGPYSLVNMIDNESKLSKSVHVVVTCVFFSNCATNPILYGLMNRQFREAYATLLAGLCSRGGTSCRNHNLNVATNDVTVERTTNMG